MALVTKDTEVSWRSVWELACCNRTRTLLHRDCLKPHRVMLGFYKWHMYLSHDFSTCIYIMALVSYRRQQVVLQLCVYFVASAHAFISWL